MWKVRWLQQIWSIRTTESQGKQRCNPALSFGKVPAAGKRPLPSERVSEVDSFLPSFETRCTDLILTILI